MPDWFLVFTLIILGFVLLALELFVIPGFGLVGILGLSCLAVASYLSYTKLSLLMGVAVSVVSIVVIILLIRIFPRTAFWKKMQLDKTTAGYSATREGLQDLVGKEGIALTSLRPVGTAIIDGKRVDVVTEMGMVDKNKKIVVVKVEGNRVVVKEAQ